MTLAPVWRTRIAALVATVAALWLGFSVANQELGWPSVIVGALAALVISVMQPLPLDTLLLGGAVIGYIAGNRGFAQISLARNIPLLPAEFVILTAGAVMIGRCIHQRVLPIRRDLLNGLILLWVAVSTVRLYSDVRTFGVMALRDYAMVYYAVFFFLGQHAADSPITRRFLLGCVIFACLALGVVFPFFIRYPDFFLGTLTFRNTPLIYYKGDLAGTFLAVGSILFYLRFETRRSWVWLAVSLALAGGTLLTDNRASMLGLIAGSFLMLCARRWRMAAWQALAGVVGAVAILLFAYVREESWHKTPLYGVYERAVSIADPFGSRTYSARDAADKGDNNMFRMMWWRTVYDDTIAHAPITGLGYGYDLAAQFVQEYYPDAGDDFLARSPHNVLLTVFARTGLIGLIPLLAVIALMVIKTVRHCRADPNAGGPWLACCAIFVSACFGVVLEGPMGAVVFWTLLGVANRAGTADEAVAPEQAQTSEAEPVAAR